MKRRIVDALRGALLDDPAQVHHGDPVSEIAHHVKGVRDDDVSRSIPLAE
jgi:hypothetical protein